MASPADLAAAQLALLAARSAISRKVRIRGPQIRVPPAHERFAPEYVVEQLAATPKPLVLSAREAGGSVEVSYRPLLPGTHEFDWYQKGLDLARERGGVLTSLITQDGGGPDKVLIHCVGRDQALLVPLAAVEKWNSDYHIEGINLRGDHVANPWCADWPDYIEAKRRGAVGIMIFSSPDDNPVRVVVRIKEEG
jgi:hypothetical protein